MGTTRAMDKAYRVIFCTCPDAGVAERIAERVVDEELAACVNLVPGLTSIYRWEGVLVHDREVLLLIKTRAERFDALAARIRALHPYDVPELIALPIVAGAPDYLAWLAAGVGLPE